MKKWWVKALLVFVAVIAMLFILLAISSVRSKNAVNRYKDQLRAAGEKLSCNDLIPPPVDPDNNAVALFNQASASTRLEGMISSNPPSGMKMIAPGRAMVGWQQTEIIFDDTPPCTNSWADLDHELQLQSAAVEFLHQASQRPQLEFTLDFTQGAMLPLPHLSKMKRTALLLSPAALAALHHGDSASAVTNLHSLLLIVNHWKDEPVLISQLVRMAMAQITFNAQWELLQSTNLTDEQMAMFQRDWTDAQFVQPMEQALLMERAFATTTIGHLRSSNSPSSGLWGRGSSSGGGGSGDWLDSLKDTRDAVKRKTSDTLWRIAWSYDDELRVLKGDQVLVEAVRQIRTNGYFKAALADRDRKLASLGLDQPETNWLRYQLDDELVILGSESVQSVAPALDRVLICEVARSLASTAIALKRYQLRHGILPRDLNALVPEFLSDAPRDPVDGHSLRYQVNADGTYQLYSIGADYVDNGGDPSPPPGKKSFQWQRGRDWVWPQPATVEEVQKFYQNPPK